MTVGAGAGAGAGADRALRLAGAGAALRFGCAGAALRFGCAGAALRFGCALRFAGAGGDALRFGCGRGCGCCLRLAGALFFFCGAGAGFFFLRFTRRPSASLCISLHIAGARNSNGNLYGAETSTRRNCIF